jgi:hypothetical protein
MNMKTYTYTIFDSNPHTSGGTAWPHQSGVNLQAASDEDARQLVKNRLVCECAALWVGDGYEVDQLIYTLIWNDDGVVIGNPPTYTLTAKNLG